MNKKEFLDKYLVDRKNTNCLKWDYLNVRYKDPDLIAMWVADMDFKTPECAIEALKNRINHGVFGYSFKPDSYFEAYSNWMEKQFGYPIKKENVFTSVGVVPALYWFLNCFTSENDSVLIMPPVYYPFHSSITDTRRRKVMVNLIHENNKYSIDYDGVEKAIKKENVKMLIFCSPHNPASRVWTEDELDKLFSICQENDVLVVSDEIHQDFTFNSHKHIPAPSVKNGKYKDNIILVNAASKTFNLAGLVHSNIVIENETLRKKFSSFINNNFPMEVNIMGFIATRACYEGGEEWLNALKEVIWDNYIYVKKTLEKELPDVQVADMQGTYLPMIDLSSVVDLKDDEIVIVNNMPVSKKLNDFVQNKCRIASDYGQWFGEDYKTYIRLNLATDPKLVKESIDNIIKNAKK